MQQETSTSEVVAENPPRPAYRTKARKWSKRWFARRFGCEVHDYGIQQCARTINEYLADLDGPLLDAACGASNVLFDKGIPGSRSIGLDVDPTVPDKNTLHDEFIIQDLHEPIQCDEKFAAIVSMFTWEHLKDPTVVLDNFRNAMREDGLLCIVAPQKWHYVPILEMMLPRPLKNLAWRFVKGRRHMPYPAFYRHCTKRSLVSAANDHGFDVLHFWTHEFAPIWFLRMPPVFIMACAYMGCLNRFRLFEGIRSTFLLVLRKRSATGQNG